MQTGAFLQRVIPQGNYLCVSVAQPVEKRFWNRMFPGDAHAEAAGFLSWVTSKGWDGYHALAAYTLAHATTDARNKPVYKGERTAANVQRLRAFWMDLDVKRDGDKKTAEQCYASPAEALAWAAKFRREAGLPPPNVGVNSGYGIHLYWVLQDPLTLADWQPQADAFKAAMVASGYRGDAGITSDAARVLRPPGTVNMKSGTPAPVTLISRLQGGDLPNELVLQPLQAYVGLVPRKAQQVVTTGVATGANAAALAGGSNVRALFGSQPDMAAAAGANMQGQRQERLFSEIAAPGGCSQVIQSLAARGNGDSRKIWLLGHLTLAHFCSDGAQFVHPISDGDPRYTPAEVDNSMALIAAEHAKKGMGPPSCMHYERERPATCQACPHYKKINGPWDLGVADGDLPERYRRARGAIEEFVVGARGEGFWTKLLPGDVYGPILDETAGAGNALTFTYRSARKTYSVYVELDGLSPDASTIYRMFQRQGIVLQPGVEPRWRAFILSWIEQLRAKSQERAHQVAPFGWASQGDKHIGYAVGGTLYKADGSEEAAPGGDVRVAELYKPQGEIAVWRRAAEFVVKGKPDMQAIVATAFAGPLMTFTGYTGLTMSAWSRDSGVGKSSAQLVANAVWSSPAGRIAFRSTDNFVTRKISEARTMPAYWDEARVGADEVERMVNLIFALGQGYEKGRLTDKAVMRPSGAWETMMVCCANSPLSEHVASQTQGTEAGLLRVFEFKIERAPNPQNADAQRTIMAVERHYGGAGRQYAKWLAMHPDKAEAVVKLISTRLIAQTKSMQSERFHIALMTVVLAGATIATKLGLMTFDLKSLESFLVATFYGLRQERVGAVLATGGGYDLVQALGQFMQDFQGNRIITDKFNQRHGAGVKLLVGPQDGRSVEIQIAVDDKLLRINRQTWNDWCRKHKLSARDTLSEMTTVWGASVDRRSIGGGTLYGGGGTPWAVDIPLTYADLECYLEIPADRVPLASRTAKLKGTTP